VGIQDQIPEGLPSIEQLLVAGGDMRITTDPLSGLNKYGCSLLPDPELLAFGSSTASAISTEAYAAANRLRDRILIDLDTLSHAVVYALEMQRLRQEYLNLCELSEINGLELIFFPSGTDLHADVAQQAGSEVATPTLIIMVEASETGSGIASVLSKHPVTGNNNVEVVEVPIRLNDGAPRPLAEVDAEVKILADDAIAAHRRVLLILVDQSKTGLIAPSPACAIKLHQRYPDNFEVLVDACQFRIEISTLRAYLDQGFMVGLTGSKFLTAPSFSAALLVPAKLAQRPQICPQRPNTCKDDQVANFGLLLRCAAALEELRRFRAVPESTIIEFIQTFAVAISQRLSSDPHFESLQAPLLVRLPLIADTNWDHLQTIFPFLLYEPQPEGRIPLNQKQTRTIYQQLPIALDHPVSKLALIRCQLGQPVSCGFRNGIPVSALRLCLSSRLIVEAETQDDQGVTIINEAMMVLDKIVWLIQHS
jgi:hypothetical protein